MFKHINGLALFHLGLCSAKISMVYFKVVQRQDCQALARLAPNFKKSWAAWTKPRGSETYSIFEIRLYKTAKPWYLDVEHGRTKHNLIWFTDLQWQWWQKKVDPFRNFLRCNTVGCCEIPRTPASWIQSSSSLSVTVETFGVTKTETGAQKPSGLPGNFWTMWRIS